MGLPVSATKPIPKLGSRDLESRMVAVEQTLAQIQNAIDFFYAGIQINNGFGAPTIVTGEVGLYFRQDGTVGNRIYVSDGAVWRAIAGV